MLAISLLLWVLPVFFSSEKIPEEILTITPLEISEAKRVLHSRTDSGSTYRKSYGVYGTNKLSGPLRSDNDTFKRAAYRKQAYAGRINNPVDINMADSIALEKLPGIGEKLSSRIIRYRDRLGGFIVLSQLSEVYGLSDSTMHIIKPLLFISKQFQPKRIDVNKAEYADLRKHPYVTHAIAKSILAYRKANGPFASVDQIGQIISIERDELTRIVPYFSIDD